MTAGFEVAGAAAFRSGNVHHPLGDAPNRVMELSQDACWSALRTRDARFDGRFVTAVRSTGIYCRPICPALPPKRGNCLFLPCAAAAQEAGFRPCLRCRPEASPGTPAWLGTSATVSRALRLISEGALDAGSADDLAARLGIGDRHLRRLFHRHLGASPLAVAQTRRLHFAKKLIDETGLPMAEVSLSSGFSSIRRFNAAIRKAYGRAPRELRGGSTGGRGSVGSSGIVLKLAFRPPLHWASLIRFLLPRVTPGVESADLEAYRRTVSIDGVKGVVEVVPSEGAHELVARIRLAGSADLIGVAERLRRIFDLGADPREISTQLGRDPYLAGAFRDLPGLRVPGTWDGFELAVRAIIGQQVSVKAASTLAPAAEPLASARLAETAEAWRPWRAYAAMALWMSRASRSADPPDSRCGRDRLSARARPAWPSS